jgi:uncharacterized protein YaeQ
LIDEKRSLWQQRDDEGVDIWIDIMSDFSTSQGEQ